MLTPFLLPLEQQALLTSLLSQSHRYYHNIEHINDCLAEMYKWWEQNKGTGLDQDLSYAIWYHDIIYNPYAPQGVNEYQSANQFLECQGRLFNSHSAKWTDKIYNAICATAYHVQDIIPDFILHNKNDEMCIKLMLDIDLSGLGKPFPIFAKNSLNITKEYPNTPKLDILKGRLKFFQELNKRESFYYTKYFKDLYDIQSKENVEQEISYLYGAINDYGTEYYFDHLKDVLY